MNIRDLEYIIAVSEQKSFIKASEVCFVSQPALSMQIKKLEDELDVILFERQYKTVILTEAGKAIVEKAKIILAEVNNLKQLAKSFHSPLSGILKMGLFPTIAQYILPDILKIFQKDLPDLLLHPVEEKTPIIEKMLNSGEIDCAILASPVDEHLFSFNPIFKDQLYAAVPAKHKLANEKTINLNQLTKEPLLLLEEGHCLRSQTLSFCAQSEHPLNINRTTTSLESLRHMVLAGFGVTIIPEIAIKGALFNSDQIRYISFDKASFRQIGLVFRKTNPNKLLETKLTESLKKYFA